MSDTRDNQGGKKVKTLAEDVAMMPAWMQRHVKPMLNER